MATQYNYGETHVKQSWISATGAECTHLAIMRYILAIPLQASLDSLVSQRELMSSQLSTPVHTLHHLKETLELLQHITDLQNVMDELYLPVERLYGLLR